MLVEEQATYTYILHSLNMYQVTFSTNESTKWSKTKVVSLFICIREYL